MHKRRNDHIKPRTGLAAVCLLTVCLLAAFLTAGCGKKEAPAAVEQTEEVPPGLVIGFSQLGSESAWRLGNTASMEKAAEEYGFNLVVDNGMQKQENQIAAIR